MSAKNFRDIPENRSPGVSAASLGKYDSIST